MTDALDGQARQYNCADIANHISSCMCVIDEPARTCIAASLPSNRARAAPDLRRGRGLRCCAPARGDASIRGWGPQVDDATQAESVPDRRHEVRHLLSAQVTERASGHLHVRARRAELLRRPAASQDPLSGDVGARAVAERGALSGPVPAGRRRADPGRGQHRLHQAAAGAGGAGTDRRLQPRGPLHLPSPRPGRARDQPLLAHGAAPCRTPAYRRSSPARLRNSSRSAITRCS